MAQRRAQIVGDGITERLQLLVGGLQLRRAFGDPLLEGFVEPADFSFRPFALRDVADVALDEPLLVHEIGVADELDLDLLPVFRLQWQTFVANPVCVVQFGERDFGSPRALEGTDFPQFLSQKFFLRIAEQIFHERTGVHHLPGVGVENEDAVLRRFKQPPVTEFGGADRLHTPRLGLFRAHLRLLRPRIGLLRPRLGLFRPRIGLLRPRLGLFRSRHVVSHALVLMIALHNPSSTISFWFTKPNPFWESVYISMNNAMRYGVNTPHMTFSSIQY